MVKVGFICEGATESILIESQAFQNHLIKLNIECILPPIDVKGKDNLLPHRINEHRESLNQYRPDFIIILTDLDENKCFTLTKERIKPLDKEVVVISVKQIESWFLSDSDLMSKLCKKNIFYNYPEKENIPIETINQLVKDSTGRGVGINSKVKFAKTAIRNGFSIENAAKHQNCDSAKYFIKKLKSLSENVI
jgi:hypothetical protein